MRGWALRRRGSEPRRLPLLKRPRRRWPAGASFLASPLTCVEIKILRRVRAESSRRPPRHRRDACSISTPPTTAGRPRRACTACSRNCTTGSSIDRFRSRRLALHRFSLNVSAQINKCAGLSEPEARPHAPFPLVLTFSTRFQQRKHTRLYLPFRTRCDSRGARDGTVVSATSAFCCVRSNFLR